ncbi:MAG: hypothetical protein M3O80_00045 [Chloroflexota bacterium]|nr:hypothetical protein [Chloroflexota bacterium]
MTSRELIELVGGAAVAFAAVWGLFRICVARETYFVWIMPLLLLTLSVGALGFSGGVRPLPAGALAGLIGGGAVLGWRSWQLQRAHLVELEDFARELGLSFSRNDQTYAPEAAVLVDEFGHCFNVLRGGWRGASVALFDYLYTDYSDLEAPAMIVLTCAVATLDVAILDDALRYLIVRGHGLKEELKLRVGDKTGLLGDEQFDRRFRVETNDDIAKARAALRARTREWLLANARGERMLVMGTTLMLCTGHRTMKQLPELLERIRALRATFV